MAQDLRRELRELTELLEKLEHEPDLLRDEALRDETRTRIFAVLSELDDFLRDLPEDAREAWKQPLAALFEAARAAHAIASAIQPVAKLVHEIIQHAGW